MEKRTKTEFARLPGDILFCHGGEPHQFITQEFPSKNINLEIDYSFYGTTTSPKVALIKPFPKRKREFLILKAYREVRTKDSDTETSIQMLLLSLMQESVKITTGIPT
ncbi:hypothetical protein [Adhaeribacter pallidiroseus]|uniref:hypothetical protein n=1 Tax=Adhaeribacter pallidiroseus TaxID=2072847 RepID=UPI000E1B6FE9|nr:hypothetical protein [Adhaeribacter pallidiroseus]